MTESTRRDEKVERLSKLASKLSECVEVTKYDTSTEKQAWTMAHAFTDLEESFRTFLGEQLPKLLNDNLEPDEIYNLLLDIGEEFRHIIYHIHDPLIYRRLLGESPPSEESSKSQD